MRNQTPFILLVVPILICVSVAIRPSPVCADQLQVRSDFLKIIERPKVPADVELKETSRNGKVVEYHFTYATDAHERVPGIIVKPIEESAVGSNQHETRRPVVIALHGTGGKKTDELPLLRELAGKGFLGVAIDGRYHGERAKEGKGSTDYQNHIAAAFSAEGSQHEHPFYYDTVWDVMRLIDYLETRDDVDKARIGLYGVSKGGIETYLTRRSIPALPWRSPASAWKVFTGPWKTTRGNRGLAPFKKASMRQRKRPA
ncbi:MAG TPA: acetylxylan esterase [Pirellulales bacterium]